MNKEYHRLYNMRRYNKYIYEAKINLGGKCNQCGSLENLEFDHIDPATKTFSVSNWLGRTKFDFWEEVKKCQLLCNTCHIAKHAIAKNTHGTLSSYRYCKCILCKTAKASYMKEYKLRSLSGDRTGFVNQRRKPTRVRVTPVAPDYERS